MTLTQNGIDYIATNFGLNDCFAQSGLSWTYYVSGTPYPESGGTAQIVSRLASGLIDNIEITNPPRGTFTQAELDTANGGTVTLQDAQTVAQHDTYEEGQWCVGSTPSPPINMLLVGIGAAAVIITAIVIVAKRR